MDVEFIMNETCIILLNACYKVDNEYVMHVIQTVQVQFIVDVILIILFNIPSVCWSRRRQPLVV